MTKLDCHQTIAHFFTDQQFSFVKIPPFFGLWLYLVGDVHRGEYSGPVCDFATTCMVICRHPCLYNLVTHRASECHFQGLQPVACEAAFKRNYGFLSGVLL